MPDKKTLDYYVAELRRVEKSRQADTEKEIARIYRSIIKELNHFLADEYADYSDGDGRLSVGVLNLRARYAKFLQEVDKHLNTVTPDISAEIRKTVEATYESVYKGMVKAVEDSTDKDRLHERFKDLNLRPEVIKNAVENPISGLTLPDTLEKHRQEIIYGIKQRINIGLMTGERYDTMAKNINKAVFGNAGVGGLYGKSMNIVRTEVHRVQESGLADSAKDINKGLEGSGLVEVAIWRTMKDKRVRPQVRVRNARGKWKTIKSKSGADHQKMEGKAIIVGDKFEVESGVFAECPGKSGTARNDCNCRCFLEYKIVSIEEAAELAGKSIEEVEKLVEKSANGGIIEKDIHIAKSLGAAAYRDEVKLPNGQRGKIAEGSKITKVVTFAGKGTNKPIKVAKYLSKQYKGVPENEWKKCRGDGFVEYENGTIKHVELHWFESKQTGRIKMKVKREFQE